MLSPFKGSPLSDSVLGYCGEVQIVQTVQVVQIVAGNFNGLNGVQRWNGATRLNGLNHNSPSEHCRACKERVRELLTAIYGHCHVNHSFTWPARPGDYEQTATGAALQRVCARLGDFRRHRDFIKSALVPPCDYY